METFSALLAICAENSPVNGEFPAQRPVTRSFNVFFDLRLNKRLGKQSWVSWFKMLSRSWWRQCNVFYISWSYCIHMVHWPILTCDASLTLRQSCSQSKVYDWQTDTANIQRYQWNICLSSCGILLTMSMQTNIKINLHITHITSNSTESTHDKCACRLS